ncbi:CDK5 regulatory subunit-associated protein 3-like [Xyrauchen texanus]|uniref:CDK5 regulatory subunit-associated protein 3-like n=1 Tax=Xyrauchen texanus TaxID=154827 RepID=UPI0022421A1C|nr:CDK5 regulatory subunit-associated protein 3-like [Xyrauchen texanus]XP_051968736.1 CDK5 regulatory subunit-associated protein 3-like [Xyrauchen texanus]
MEKIQNLPIDIQTSKLLDWLVDRRHCTLKWQSAVMTIREKINVAIQDMPENEEIKQLLSGTYIHYFHCLRIIEILKGTEASTKNIFGRYSSQRMKDWQEIVSVYEKDNVYLAEVASLLFRSVSYEGPALRKQVSKAQQLQQELSRREVECQSGAADMRERFYAACKQYGIKGENVARELQALVKDLPVVLEGTGKKAACLKEASEFYTAFTDFVCGWSEPVLPMLRFVQQKGNTTVYEWKTGNVPTVIERPVMEEAPLDVVTEETIDWGNLGSGAGTEEVNVGISVEDGVDWGISLESGPEETGAGGIDWGISESTHMEIEVVDVGTDCPDGVARGEDALSLLENSQTRSQFIDELMELELFLCQRLREMNEEGDVVAMSQFQLAPSVIQAQTPERVQVMLAEVRGLLNGFTTLRMQHLFMIQASPRYVDRVSELLRQKLKQADILVLKRNMLAEKRQEALEEQARLEPRIDLLAARTKELQKLIEADISKRYNNRPVNLMGVHV